MNAPTPALPRAAGEGEDRLERMRTHLATALTTDDIELIDDSHRHAGHAGARDGRGHFRVRVVAEKFAGLRSLQRHQLVYQSLGDMMQTDIHALNIVALTPEEAQAAARPVIVEPP